MCCSSSQSCLAVVPGSLEVLLWEELTIALQGPGQGHLGASFPRDLHAECYLCIHWELQGVHVHIRSSRFQCACKPLDVEVLIQRFQQDLCLCCWPLRIWRYSNAPNGLQEFSKSKELLLQAPAASVNSPHHTCRGIFEEHYGQFSPKGLSLMGPILLPSKGLVL